MKRTLLDKDLQELEAQVLRLSTLAKNALEQALKAFETSNQDKAGLVVMGDTTIDELHLAIEEHTLRILTLQQGHDTSGPYSRRDWRYLISVVPISIDLERIGDEAEGIAQDVLRMVSYGKHDMHKAQGENDFNDSEDGVKPNDEAPMMQRMFNLGREVRTLIDRTMQAFAERDAQIARAIWEKGRAVHHRHYLIQRDLMAMLEESHALPALQHDPHMLHRVTYLLWIAHKLERVADHCTNICERIVFMVEGEKDIASLPQE